MSPTPSSTSNVSLPPALKVDRSRAKNGGDFPKVEFSRVRSVLERLSLPPEPIIPWAESPGRSKSSVISRSQMAGRKLLVTNAYKLATGSSRELDDLRPIELGQDLVENLAKMRVWHSLSRHYSNQESQSEISILANLLSDHPFNSSPERLVAFRNFLPATGQLLAFNAEEISAAIRVCLGNFDFGEMNERSAIKAKHETVEKFNSFLDRFGKIDLKLAARLDSILKIDCIHDLVLLAPWISRAYNEFQVVLHQGGEFPLYEVAPPDWARSVIPDYSGHNLCIYSARSQALLSSSLGNDCLRAILSMTILLEYCRQVSLAIGTFRSPDDFKHTGGRRFGLQEMWQYDPICTDHRWFYADQFLETSQSETIDFEWDNIWNETLARSSGVPFLPANNGISDETLGMLRSAELIVSPMQSDCRDPLGEEINGERLVWNRHKLPMLQEIRRRGESSLDPLSGREILDCIKAAKLSAGEIESIRGAIENSGVRGFGKFKLGNGVNVAIITAANAKGKSTFLNAVCEAVHAHQFGRKVLLKGRLSVVDRIFLDQPDLESVVSNLSRLQGQVETVAEFLNKGTPRSLGLFDELFHGTSTPYQLSLAWAVLEEIRERNLHAIVTTHVGELTAFATEDGLNSIRGIFKRGREIVTGTSSASSTGAKNYSISPGFHMQGGAILDSDALSAARDHGMPEKVLARAKELIEWIQS